MSFIINSIETKEFEITIKELDCNRFVCVYLDKQNSYKKTHEFETAGGAFDQAFEICKFKIEKLHDYCRLGSEWGE